MRVKWIIEVRSNYWRLKGGNGEIVSHSQSLSSHRNARRTAEKLFHSLQRSRLRVFNNTLELVYETWR